ncbi:uncharacterized protein LOC119558327 [Drosophila subpulchrella]|uniref:uncharacterized protein LOC119558327 n=1 Tax=Drosophila subpulchrella TaxID=1486046 RepID=UPI0018A1886F|nr:uncharacterized protein LOC119558327 [Drosophila subpulchrella]
MVFYLEHVITGDRVFLDEGENTLGRDPDCSFKMEYDYMSRKHVTILVENGKIFVKELESRNGTFVNYVGFRVSKEYREISVGDDLLFGIIVPYDVLVHKYPPTLGIFTLMEEEQDTEDSVDSSLNPADKSPNLQGSNPE